MGRCAGSEQTTLSLKIALKDNFERLKIGEQSSHFKRSKSKVQRSAPGSVAAALHPERASFARDHATRAARPPSPSTSPAPPAEFFIIMIKYAFSKQPCKFTGHPKYICENRQ